MLIPAVLNCHLNDLIADNLNQAVRGAGFIAPGSRYLLHNSRDSPKQD
jgi:hypothetical protein